MVTGCSIVTTPKPIGTVLKKSEGIALQGAWTIELEKGGFYKEDQEIELFIRHHDDGRLAIVLAAGGDKHVFLACRGVLSRHSGCHFINLSLNDLVQSGLDECEGFEKVEKCIERGEKWIFARVIERSPGHLVIAWPHPVNVIKAIEENKLEGQCIERERHVLSELLVAVGVERYLTENGASHLFQAEGKLTHQKAKRTVTSEEAFFCAWCMDSLTSSHLVGLPLSEDEKLGLKGFWHIPGSENLAHRLPEFNFAEKHLVITRDETNRGIVYLNIVAPTVRMWLTEGESAFCFFRIEHDPNKQELRLFSPNYETFRKAVRDNSIAGMYQERFGLSSLLISAEKAELDSFVDAKNATEQFEMDKPILVLTRKVDGPVKE